MKFCTEVANMESRGTYRDATHSSLEAAAQKLARGSAAHGGRNLAREQLERASVHWRPRHHEEILHAHLRVRSEVLDELLGGAGEHPLAQRIDLYAHPLGACVQLLLRLALVGAEHHPRDQLQTDLRAVAAQLGEADDEVTYVALANSWVIINLGGGGPTDDKPTVTLETQPDPDRVSSFLNIGLPTSKLYTPSGARGAPNS
jgi:hypothetical protein